MNELGIVLDFKAKMITIDEIILPMRNINHLHGTSTLCVDVVHTYVDQKVMH
jgi:hypothetical protein